MCSITSRLSSSHFNGENLNVIFYRYVSNEILSFDWLNADLTLGNVGLVGSNMRLVPNSKRISHLKRDQC